MLTKLALFALIVASSAAARYRITLHQGPEGHVDLPLRKEYILQEGHCDMELDLSNLCSNKSPPFDLLAELINDNGYGKLYLQEDFRYLKATRLGYTPFDLCLGHSNLNLMYNCAA